MNESGFHSKKKTLKRESRMNLNCPKPTQTLTVRYPSLRLNYHHFAHPEIEIVLVFVGLADFAVFHHFFDPFWLGISFYLKMIYEDHDLLHRHPFLTMMSHVHSNV